MLNEKTLGLILLVIVVGGVLGFGFLFKTKAPKP